MTLHELCWSFSYPTTRLHRRNSGPSRLDPRFLVSRNPFSFCLGKQKSGMIDFDSVVGAKFKVEPTETDSWRPFRLRKRTLGGRRKALTTGSSSWPLFGLLRRPTSRPAA